jgi:hypothetical protein
MKYLISIFVTVLVVFGTANQAKADLFPESLRFEVGATYGKVSPKDINNMLDEINTIYPGSTYEKIEYIRGVNFAVRQALSSHFGVLVGVGYLFGRTNTQKFTLRTVFVPQGYEVDHDYRLSTIPISIGPEIWYESGKFIFRVGASAVLHYIKFEERFGENQDAGYSGDTKSWSSTSLGADIALSAEWNPMSKYFVGGRFGYGITGNSELTHDDQSAPIPINADLSGYHVSIYIGFAPWN